MAAASVRYPPGTADCADEILTIFAYLTARDGPLQADPVPGAPLRHETLLRKAAERLELIEAYLRARLAYLAAGRDSGYSTSQTETELAGVALDTARTAATVVEALLAARLPSRHDFDAMSVQALRLNPALDALRDEEAGAPS